MLFKLQLGGINGCGQRLDFLLGLVYKVIQYFFDEYKNADLNDPAVRDYLRDYLLDYFVDKIFVYDDRVVLTAWYGDDKKEITWGDIDCAVVKKRKRKKSSSASGQVPSKNPKPFNTFIKSERRSDNGTNQKGLRFWVYASADERR